MMGMASGMDTDFIIQQTLRMHQMRIDTQLRQRTLLQWRQDTHTGIRDQIAGFRNNFLSNLGVNSMINRNAFNTNKATASGKNADAVTVRALPGTSTNNIRIGNIDQLARGARAVTNDTVANSNKTNLNMTSGIGALFGGAGGSLSFSANAADVKNVDGENVKVLQTVATAGWDAHTTSTSSFKTSDGVTVTLTRDASTPGAYSFTAVKDDEILHTGIFTLSPDGETKITLGTEPDSAEVTLTKNAEGKISFGTTALDFVKEREVAATDGSMVKLTQSEDGTIRHNGNTMTFYGETSINVNGKDVRLTSNMNISQMVNAVNNSGAGVRMSYEQLNGRFTIESTAIGADARLDLTDSASQAFFAAIGFGPQIPTDNNGTPTGLASMMLQGKDAIVHINGDRITTNSNSFNFGGVAITLNRETQDAGTGAVGNTNENTIMVNLSRDVTDAMARIKDFVNAYNSIIARIEGLVKDRKAPNEVSYKPLTDEEKRGMSDKQIEEWETIAKKGILRNDQGLQDLARNLRAQLFEEVSAAGMKPFEIGLTTGNFFGGTGGQIVIDEEKLRAALEADPDKVADIFSSTEGNRGLLWRMNSILGDYVSGSQPHAIRNLESSIRRTNEQIEKMQNRMYAEEDRLYRQFAAMETALSRMQSQGDWFNSMLGGLQKK